MTQLATRASTVRDLLKKMAPQFALAAPKHLDVDRLIRLALNQIQRTPKLLECTEPSLLGCLMACGQVGLYPDSVGQKAHLIPRKVKGVMTCTIVFGFKGLSDLARRSPDVSDILLPQVVYRNDEFSRTLGQNPTLTHVPTEGDRGAIRGFYAVGVLASGERPFSYLTEEEVQAVKARATAQMGGTGPWFTDYPAMGMKTAILRLCKYLPCADDVQTAIGLDERAEAGIEQGIDFYDVDGASQPAEPKSNADIRDEMSKTKSQLVADKVEEQDHVCVGEPPVFPGEQQTSVPADPAAKQPDDGKASESDIQCSELLKEWDDLAKGVDQPIKVSALKNAGINGILSVRKCTAPAAIEKAIENLKTALVTSPT